MVLATILFGSTLQRISGMGLGLVAGSVLSIALGPVEGVLVVNILTCVNAIFSSVSMRRHIQWNMVGIIGPAMLVGAIPGAILISQVSTAALQVIVGAGLLLGLALVTVGKNVVPQASGKPPAVVAGIAGGFMNTLAGVAGPLITIYAQASRWDHRYFAATLQPLFVIAGGVSVAVKLVMGTAGISDVHWGVWPVALLGIAIASVVGTRLARRVPKETARKVAITVATAGAASVFVRGLISLVG